MSLSGPEALRSLDEALRDIRREEDEIAKRLARSAELVTKFKETESELLRQLAEVRLEPDVQAVLTGRLSQAELKARDMLSKHGANLSAAESELMGSTSRSRRWPRSAPSWRARPRRRRASSRRWPIGCRSRR